MAQRESKASSKATTKYQKSHTKAFVFRCNLEADADLIGHLAEVGNVAGYLKDLVRRDMAAGARGQTNAW